jgi:2-methylcitrate dehydratase PrpD
MTPFGSTAQMPDPQALEARPAVARIAAFAVAARPERLTPEIRQLFKRNILDSLACAIAALPGRPFAALRDQFEEYRAPGRCTLIGGGKTSLDQAALFNSGLTRYVDLLDSYMSPGGLAHPSDNFGTVLAAADMSDRLISSQPDWKDKNCKNCPIAQSFPQERWRDDNRDVTELKGF